MALSKSKKQSVVDEVSGLLQDSKMTVVAKYTGTSVKAMQSLRRDAKANGTKVKVIKNRLVIQAIKSSDKLKSADTASLQGMLVYAFNAEDEVAPAQSLHNFAKLNSNLEFVGAFTPEGEFLSAERVKALAVLPGKNQLLAGLINTLSSPVHGVMSSLSSTLPAIIKGLESQAKS